MSMAPLIDAAGAPSRFELQRSNPCSTETWAGADPGTGPHRQSRRCFIGTAMATLVTASLRAQPKRVDPPSYPVIDTHQHTSFQARDDADLLDHQQRLGVSK